MSDDTRYPCCIHTHPDERAFGWTGTCGVLYVSAVCDVAGCPGSVPVGPTKEGKQ